MVTSANLASGGQAPGGLSWARFKAMSAEAGQWLWGTARGAFNDKASFSQIVVDAVIGMIPVAGDVTAARDLIAVTMGLVDDPKKREEVWEWVLLVVLVFALIPVLGGVIKGVGRIVVKVAKEAELLVGAARAAHLAEGAREVISFLNRIGYRNAEKWLLSLKVADYQAHLMQRFDGFVATFNGVLVQIQRKAGGLLSDGMRHRFDALQSGLAKLKELAADMIPKAVKELDQKLKEIQAYVRSGGETTSRLVSREVAAGTRVVTRAEEARLIESGALPVRSADGWKQNVALTLDPKSYEAVYKHEPGYPDLTRRVDKGRYTAIEANSGRIINREIRSNETLYRLFGPEGVTHGTNVDKSFAGGVWWGLGTPPATANEWRMKSAVLDEWNRDGYMVIARPSDQVHLKSAVGTISEQSGKGIPGQYLPGGATQAFMQLEKGANNSLNALAEEVIKTGKPQRWVDPATGMDFEIKPTGWTDANGRYGYVSMPGVGKVQTARLGAREMATKEHREVVK